jgi:hypothetical protein
VVWRRCPSASWSSWPDRCSWSTRGRCSTATWRHLRRLARRCAPSSRAKGRKLTLAEPGEVAALEALDGHGKQADRVAIEWTGAQLVRCQPVTATVRYQVPLLVVPWIGAFGGGVLSTSARHREVVDPFRRGLSVEGVDLAGCGA